MAGIEIGGNVFAGAKIGNKVLYQGSDGWIPLELPDGVNGLVLFRDNGDNTASIIGNVGISSQSSSVTNKMLLSPPEGYVFKNCSWQGLMPSPSIFSRIPMYAYGAPIVRSSASLAISSEGIMIVKQLFQQDSGGNSILIGFNKASTNSEDSFKTVSDSFAEPAIIPIERV